MHGTCPLTIFGVGVVEQEFSLYFITFAREENVCIETQGCGLPASSGAAITDGLQCGQDYPYTAFMAIP